MTPGDWRALIEAYLDGRLSAEAFARRFLDAWRAQRDARQTPIPDAIERLFFAVEAFEPQVLEAGEEGVVNDDDMRQAAQIAHHELAEAPAIAAHTFDRTRAREDMRRFRIQVAGCAGVGCLIAFAWVALCVLQVFIVIEWVQQAFDLPALIATIVGAILAFVPIVGNVLAFLGATEIWNWPTWLAAIVFFAAPAVTILSGWSRWRRYGPRG